MKLFIDAGDQNEVRLELIFNKRTVRHVFFTGNNLSEKLISEIEKFLKKQKVNLNKIEKIEVNPGPGPFSRIRTAVATANAAAFALDLNQKMVKPIYDRAPNITRPKKSW